MERTPTLLDSCARAATAAEARFRVDYPNSRGRVSRIVALDEDAIPVLQHAADGPWSEGAHFLSYVQETTPPGLESVPVDAVLRDEAGAETLLSDELTGADVVVMIAGSDRAAAAASVIGNACTARRIMTAGLVVDEGEQAGAAVSALRPYASVLVVASDEDYVTEMLAALRA